MTPNINLSRGELLKLLSVFEGELQARDEVIAILKSEVSSGRDTRYTINLQVLLVISSSYLQLTNSVLLHQSRYDK